MSGHDSTAKSVRLQKEQHPERYCTNPRCLWRTEKNNRFDPCPRHMRSQIQRVVAEAACVECSATRGMHEENCPTLKVPA